MGRKKNNFTGYSGLEMGYVHEKQEFIVTYAGSSATQETTTNGYRGNLVLGFQYNFNKHLAVFGEVGFGFLKENTDYPDISRTTKLTYWSLSRSGFGIILYL